MGFHGGWSWPATWWPLSWIFVQFPLPETCLTVAFFPKIQTDISWFIEGLGCFGGFRFGSEKMKRDWYHLVVPDSNLKTTGAPNHQPINHYPLPPPIAPWFCAKMG